MERPSFFRTTYGHVLIALLGVAGIAALIAYVGLANRMSVQTADSNAVTISVNGEGKVEAKPDIGQFSFSVMAEATSAADAQQQSATNINAIMAYLKSAGIAETDIKTQDYNLSPKYAYDRTVCPVGTYCPPSDPKVVGYTVSQTIVVKVRKLDQAGDLITGVGQKGATNISDLSFTIDDPTTLQAEARTKAIADAQQKAAALAGQLGMQLGKLTSFSAANGPTPGPIMYAAKSDAMGSGAAVSPSMPTGQSEITSDVTMTYQLR